MQTIELLRRHKPIEYLGAYFAVGTAIGALFGVIRGFKLVNKDEDSPLDALSRGQLFHASFVMSWGAVLGAVSGFTLTLFSPVIVPALIIRSFGKKSKI
ncbi:hypothetical protein BNJ_00394 [Kaumoebavirus]|uniref:hypothetical protein n=1 Tax=Kaumoebavirus TaxID=1859492 RepID=UPI0009C26C77|nr:hypothetical protein BNJ_00394 [Kaumoebavirus]ARA72213.1 hypothetical protein BNJ_00394 [Kaumoebavirus]